MASSFQLSIVAPDRTVFEGDVTGVVAPGREGYFGVLAGHEPMIAALRTGILEYEDTYGMRSYVVISGGFAEIGHNGVIVLAEDAEPSAEIDALLAEEQLEEARKALRGEHSSMTSEQATGELERAMVRVRAARTKKA